MKKHILTNSLHTFEDYKECFFIILEELARGVVIILTKVLDCFKLVLLIIFIQVTFLFSTNAAHAEEKIYKIAGEWALPPFSFKNKDGTLTGISIDLMEQVARKNGLHFEYVPMSSSEAEKALKDGSVDAIAGVTYSTEKDKWFDFSNPYFTMSDSLIIPKEKESHIKKITDIRNLHVVLEKGTSVLGTMLNMRNTNLTLTSNQYSGLVTLINGRADVFIGNKWTATYYLKNFEQDRNFIILDEVIEPADYAIAVKNGNESLLHMINQTLTAMKAKGEVNEIIDQWVNQQVQVEIDQLEHFIFLLLLALTIFALVLLIIYIWNQRLKKAVNNQTRTLSLLNENLQEQQQKLADNIAFKDQILTNIDTGIVTFDLYFIPTSCNDRALDILGLSSTKTVSIQDSSSFIHFLHIFDIKRAKQRDIKGTLELHIDGDKRRKNIYYHLLHMYDSQGKHTGYLLSINDETEKKKLEQKLITQEKLHALGQLVAGVAHEIRNPLTSIKTYIDLLPSKYEQPKFREMMIKHLPSEVNRLNAIVSDLVDYARPRPPNKQQISAFELTSLWQFLHVTFEQKQIVLEESIADNLVFFIDQQQIRQVLLNLILNAIHALEEKDERKITIYMEKEDKDTGRIMISDTGIGMNPEEQQRIFDPFYTNKEKGVGLGLTLSYKLIKENNGDIYVNSQPNQGTTFTITLPLYEEEEVNSEATCISLG